MKLQNTTEDPIMSSSFCFFKSKPLLLIASSLVISLVFYASFFGFGFGFGFGFSSILFTFLVLIVSNIILFIFTNQKPVTDQETLDSDHHETSPILQHPAESDEAAEALMMPQNEEEEELVEADDEQQIRDYSNKSSTKYFLSSESESLNNRLSSSEESEVEWPFREIVSRRSSDCTDNGSISDEEGDLIEISLPSGHYVGNSNKDDEDVPKFHFWKQHGLMELLAADINDVNEEDNLIEIDISMGSIKCSRFEMEACS